MRALEPAGRHLADTPAETVALHQQLDAVTEATVRLDWNLGCGAARKKAKAIAGIMRRQARQVIESKICRADEKGFQPRAADHASSSHETAGANDVAAPSGFSEHRIEDRRIVIVVGRIHDHERRVAWCKSREHRAMRATPAVAHKFDCHLAKRATILGDRRQGVVILAVVADQHATRCFHLARDCAQRRHNIGALVVDGDDNVQLRPRAFGHGFSPLVSTKGRNGLMNPRLNTEVSMKLYTGSSMRARPDAT